MPDIFKRLKEQQTLVSDGAWGTFLHEKGLAPGECPELWNVTRPDDVLGIAQSYINAGADMIETNSFGASRFKLDHYALGDRAFELNEAAAAISRKAAGDDHIVLGSIGPTGKILMMGETTEDELYSVFSEQAQALEAGGADVIVVETMSALDEADIAIRAARENTKLPVICTFTFEQTVDGGYRTMMGVAPDQMAKTTLDAGASIIGCNCGNGMERMVDILKELSSAAPDTPLLVHANAGTPVVEDGKTVFPETPQVMASLIKDAVEAGARIVGGCCGTTPEHIRAIANIVHH